MLFRDLPGKIIWLIPDSHCFPPGKYRPPKLSFFAVSSDSERRKVRFSFRSDRSLFYSNRNAGASSAPRFKTLFFGTLSEFADLSPPGYFGIPELPGSLFHTRNCALVCKLTQADTADTVFTEISVRTAADLTSVIFSCRIFLSFLLLEDH